MKWVITNKKKNAGDIRKILSSFILNLPKYL